MDSNGQLDWVYQDVKSDEIHNEKQYRSEEQPKFLQQALASDKILRFGAKIARGVKAYTATR